VILVIADVVKVGTSSFLQKFIIKTEKIISSNSVFLIILFMFDYIRNNFLKLCIFSNLHFV
jgi:hypothetical protein